MFGSTARYVSKARQLSRPVSVILLVQDKPVASSHCLKESSPTLERKIEIERRNNRLLVKKRLRRVTTAVPFSDSKISLSSCFETGEPFASNNWCPPVHEICKKSAGGYVVRRCPLTKILKPAGRPAVNSTVEATIE
jgi:hypothetical protein